MKLLRVRATNHKSFRGVSELDLTRPGFTTNRPRKGKSWDNVTYPAIVLYGANGSGKSNMLDALRFICEAIHKSASSWLDNETMVRSPFRLTQEGRQSPSDYEIDFVHEDIRYHYTFTIDAEGIVAEQLIQYRSSRPAVLLERSRSDKICRVEHEDFDGVNPRALAWATIRVNAIETTSNLRQVAQALVDGFVLGGSVPGSMGFYLEHMIDSDRVSPEFLARLAQVADTGIANIYVSEPDHRLPFKIRRKRLVFEHGGADEGGDLMIRDESSGTLSWLVLMLHAWEALTHGGVYVVDELDSSLHPKLCELIYSLFTDPHTNKHGAQIIATTHDVSLLSVGKTLGMEKPQFWMVEKNFYGESEIFSLADFADLRAGSNLERQYLSGRLGAIPTIDPIFLYNALQGSDDEE